MFNGTSFLQFIGLQRNVLSFTEIEIIVKPSDRDGLILYNGYNKDGTGDFISLALNDGFVEYRFDLGTGAAHIRFDPCNIIPELLYQHSLTIFDMKTWM